MSQQESTTRQHLIIKKLQNCKRATFEEINDYLSLESELRGYHFEVTKRTFQRDIRAIEQVFRIYIKYDFSGKYYFIEDEGDSETNERLFEAYDIYHALNINEQNKNYLYLENRHAQGTEHLYGLLHAIKNRFQIAIAYQKYYQDSVSHRTLEPLALKEFKYRWYLFARDVRDGQVKTYGLDRMADLEISKTKFPKNTEFNLAQILKHCFGIITPNDEKPHRVVLSFEPRQGKYIKSLPLHETQKILIDNDNELRISLDIYLTHDFKMELLSYGDTVKVLEPKQLVKEMKNTYSKALEQYSLKN